MRSTTTAGGRAPLRWHRRPSGRGVQAISDHLHYEILPALGEWHVVARMPRGSRRPVLRESYFATLNSAQDWVRCLDRLLPDHPWETCRDQATEAWMRAS